MLVISVSQLCQKDSGTKLPRMGFCQLHKLPSCPENLCMRLDNNELYLANEFQLKKTP